MRIGAARLITVVTRVHVTRPWNTVKLRPYNLQQTLRHPASSTAPRWTPLFVTSFNLARCLGPGHEIVGSAATNVNVNFFCSMFPFVLNSPPSVPYVQLIV